MGKGKKGQSRFDHFLLESYFSLQFAEWAIGFLVAGALCIALGIILYVVLPTLATQSTGNSVDALFANGTTYSRFTSTGKETNSFTFANYADNTDVFNDTAASCTPVSDAYTVNITRTNVTKVSSGSLVSYTFNRTRTVPVVARKVINQPSFEFAQVLRNYPNYLNTTNGEVSAYLQGLLADDYPKALASIFNSTDGDFAHLYTHLLATRSIRSVVKNFREFAIRSFANYLNGTIYNYTDMVVAADISNLGTNFNIRAIYLNASNILCGTPASGNRSDTELTNLFFKDYSACTNLNSSFKARFESLSGGVTNTNFSSVFKKFLSNTPANTSLWSYIVETEAICKPGNGYKYYNYTDAETDSVRVLCNSVLPNWISYLLEYNPFNVDYKLSTTTYANRTQNGIRKFCFDSDNSKLVDSITLSRIPTINRTSDSAFAFANSFSNTSSLFSVFSALRFTSSSDNVVYNFTYTLLPQDDSFVLGSINEATLSKCQKIATAVSTGDFAVGILSTADHVFTPRAPAYTVTRNSGENLLNAESVLTSAVNGSAVTATNPSNILGLSDDEIATARRFLYRMDGAVSTFIAEIVRRTVLTEPSKSVPTGSESLLLYNLPGWLTASGFTSSPADISVNVVRALIFPVSATAQTNSLSYLPSYTYTSATAFSGARTYTGLPSMFNNKEDSTLPTVLFNSLGVPVTSKESVLKLGQYLTSKTGSQLVLNQFQFGGLLNCSDLSYTANVTDTVNYPSLEGTNSSTYCGVAQLFYRNYFAPNVVGSIPVYPVEFGNLKSYVGDNSLQFTSSLGSSDTLSESEATAYTLNTTYLSTSPFATSGQVPTSTARYYYTLAKIAFQGRIQLIDSAFRLVDNQKSTLDILDGRTVISRLSTALNSNVQTKTEGSPATGSKITANSGQSSIDSMFTAATSSSSNNLTLFVDAYLFPPSRPVAGGSIRFQNADWTGAVSDSIQTYASCGEAQILDSSPIADVSLQKCTSFTFDKESYGLTTIGTTNNYTLRTIPCSVAKSLSGLQCRSTLFNSSDSSQGVDPFVIVEPTTGVVIQSAGCWVVAVELNATSTSGKSVTKLFGLYRRDSAYLLDSSLRSGFTSTLSGLQAGATTALVVLVIIGSIFVIAGVVFLVFWSLARKKRLEQTSQQELVLDPFGEKTSRTVKV